MRQEEAAAVAVIVPVGFHVSIQCIRKDALHIWLVVFLEERSPIGIVVVVVVVVVVVAVSLGVAVILAVLEKIEMFYRG